MEMKYIYAFNCALLFSIAILLLNNRKTTYEILVYLFALSIPLNLDINFLNREHVGGATGISFSLSIITGLGMGFIYIFNRFISGYRPVLKFNPIVVSGSVIYSVTGFLSLLTGSSVVTG